MLKFGTRAHGASRRREVLALGLRAHKGEWMESGDDPVLSPTVFLAEQPANSTVLPHFHRQNQFQLFVQGGGSIGPNPLGPFTVHYAGAYTGYGPLVAGPVGLKYFTIRQVCDSGALSLDDAREKMVRGPKRHAASAPFPPATIDEFMQLRAATSFEAIPVAEDGLGARVVRVPPHAAINTAQPSAATGAFMIVLMGQVGHPAGILSEWDSMFVSTQEELPPLSAGPQGAQVVFLFMPAKAQAYLSADR